MRKLNKTPFCCYPCTLVFIHVLYLRQTYLHAHLYIPVFIAPVWDSRKRGIMRPASIEVPIMVRFLEDDRSTKLRAERPTEVTTPKLTKMIPPRTESGIVVKNAPIFPTTPLMRKIAPAVKNADLLPT